MTEIIPMDDAATATWSADWLARMNRWFTSVGADIRTEQIVGAWARGNHRMAAHLVDGGEVVGHVAYCIPVRQDREDPVGTVVDLWVDPARRLRGHGRAAREAAAEGPRSRAPKTGAPLGGA